jgi:antitoxin FitA
MGRTVQIRDLDEHTYTVLKGRAAAAGLSLTQYLRGELDNLARLRSMLEVLERADARRERGAVVGSEALRAAHQDERADRR